MFASLSSSLSGRNPPAPAPTSSTTTTTTSQNLSVSSASRAQHSQSSNTSVSASAPQAHHHHVVGAVQQQRHAPLAPGPASSASASPPPQQQLHQTLPSEDQEQHISEARAAVVASIGNMLDGELQSRARMLHANAAALDKQERDVVRATEALRKENDKLAKFSGDAARRVKELGNVQNWAEVLERDFLVLQETFRLVREGSCGSGCESCCGSEGSGSWSGSEVGDEDERMGEDGRGGAKEGEDDKGKMKQQRDKLVDMEIDGLHEDCSESQSLTEAESSTGTDGRAKESETTSISTL
ncbi:hypothetical protein CORC01_11450 [Colletotrichum orchidophilum]|uniref:Biogenesis of lysosome-related organelles complex 1 subunit 1 n=1 Tax=Colletotrichum orchidophilum TaxID=1209926 RepID=A0A1G4AVU2_9PEZI|nr:uncharacterized protein CORC01_11450 [Colletotrichum orchidophilum]OHE93225.1 hypothetical protein CORC01_11450 [Colletotrichum orchidophilum]